jgi:hypothetical protein
LSLPSQSALTSAHRSSDHCSFIQIQSTAFAKASVDFFLTPQSSRLALTIIELLHGAHAAAPLLRPSCLFTLPMTTCLPSLMNMPRPGQIAARRYAGVEKPLLALHKPSLDSYLEDH